RERDRVVVRKRAQVDVVRLSAGPLHLDQDRTPEVVDPTGPDAWVRRLADRLDVQAGGGVVSLELLEECESGLLHAPVELLLGLGPEDDLWHQAAAPSRPRRSSSGSDGTIVQLLSTNHRM